jgi:hypothetical protein
MVLLAAGGKGVTGEGCCGRRTRARKGISYCDDCDDCDEGSESAAESLGRGKFLLTGAEG